MGNSVGTPAGNIVPWFHFTHGDVLWFKGWAVWSNGGITGTCIGLFLLSLLDRWVAAYRSIAQERWAQRCMDMPYHDGAMLLSPGKKHFKDDMSGVKLLDILTMRNGPPFVASRDLVRGALYALQSLFHYSLMFALMTFQIAFFLSVVIGVGVGEILFGRHGRSAGSDDL